MISVKLHDDEQNFLHEELYTNRRGLQYLYESRETHKVSYVKVCKLRGWLHVYLVEKKDWLESFEAEEIGYYLANQPDRIRSPLYSPGDSPHEQVLVHHA